MTKPTPPETPGLSVEGDLSGQAIAGHGNLQIGRIDSSTVNITLPGQRREPLPPYTPPSPPDPDILPDPGQLPPGSRVTFHRNALFTGREEPLKDLARALLHGEKPFTLVTQAVQGMGGVGKTQLAVEFTHRYGRFFHGVHWLDAAQPTAIGAEVAACGEAMCLERWSDEQPEQVALTLTAWQRGGPRLVVLDNLEDVAATREWLGRLSGGPVRLLLTARRSDWPADLGLDLLKLDVFAPEESLAFLRRYLPRKRASDEDLGELGKRLGYLALALELAGRYLKGHPRLSVAGYLEKLEEIWEHPSMAGWREDLEGPTRHDLDLAATFAVSWERVEDEGVRRVFLLAGYCAPNWPIPCELLEQASGLEEEACDEAVGILTGLGLLEMEDAEAGPVIHPLLAEYARSISEKGVLIILANALGALAQQANQSGLLARFVPLRSHVEVVASATAETGIERGRLLWGEMGYYLHDIADYAGACTACERALAIAEGSLDPDHPQIAVYVNNLGTVLRGLGNLTGARAAFERAMVITEKAFGPDHPDVAIYVNNLGTVLHALSDPTGARVAFERALAIAEKALEPNHPQVAICVNNLGNELHDLGDLAGALTAYERALTIAEEALDPDHPQVAFYINNLGTVLRDLGDLSSAQAAFERALVIDEKALGPGHPSVATDVNNLGGVLKALGDLDGAREAYERAMVITEKAFGPDHPDVARDFNNLGTVLHALDDLVGAHAAFERALYIFGEILPSDHPDIKLVQENLKSLEVDE